MFGALEPSVLLVSWSVFGPRAHPCHAAILSKKRQCTMILQDGMVSDTQAYMSREGETAGEAAAEGETAQGAEGAEEGAEGDGATAEAKAANRGKAVVPSKESTHSFAYSLFAIRCLVFYG
jgi:hypothetical protein